MNVPRPVLKFDKKDIDRWVKKLGDNLKNTAPMIEAAYKIWGVKDIWEHFRKEEGPEGKWKQRSQFTQEYYEAINRGATPPVNGLSKDSFNPRNKLLQMTGQTRQSISENNTRVLNDNAVLVFANTDYSGQHNRGDKSKNIPKREFMFFSKKAYRGIVRTISEMLLP